jgi:2-polyprenyl-3-methyl-5-hydroxy-6-metoxy-1,4-benzoquinol methylase
MRMMATATGALFELWKSKGAQSEEDFYRRQDVGLLYALDLANWHIAGGCPLMSTLDGTGKRWFDYGCGIGTLGLAAAENGYSVSGYEPNAETRTFANWRARKYGLDAEFDGDGIVWRSGFYDVVSCWHVFEHIKDPTIALERIRHILKPGGLLISESGFEDTATPMHHSHPDWEGELRRYGFVKTAEEFTYQLMPVSEMVPA